MKNSQPLNRKAFLTQLSELGHTLRVQIEAEVDGFKPDASAIQARRKQAFDDYEFFAHTYFPHYVKKSNSKLHEYLYKRLPEIAKSQASETDAIAAPRGEAKSTLTTQLFVLWCVITGRKFYPIIGMDAFDQAAIMLEAIKAELEFNPRLSMDFPECTGSPRECLLDRHR